MSKRKIQQRKGTLRATSRSVAMVALGLVAVIGSFSAGLQTSSDVIGGTEASDVASVEGDMDGNGFVDVRDVRVALDIVLGTIEASAEHLRSDPTHDGRITVEDARQIADMLSR